VTDGPVANRREYERRVNRVVDHIGEQLDAELTLAVLARVASAERSAVGRSAVPRDLSRAQRGREDGELSV